MNNTAKINATLTFTTALPVPALGEPLRFEIGEYLPTRAAPGVKTETVAPPFSVPGKEGEADGPAEGGIYRTTVTLEAEQMRGFLRRLNAVKGNAAREHAILGAITAAARGV